MFSPSRILRRVSLTKRLFDISCALLALLVFAVPMLVVAVLVRWRLGTPVFFRQTRPGLHGKPFELVKFRTMLDARDSQGAPLSDAERLTPFGSFLRSSSLDELPEIWNILRGDMSWVGPRPLLMEYLPRYSSEQARRHEVRPGLTGWAQVNGRNAAGWQERFELDVWYIENWSLWLDLKILFRTVLTVLRSEGVSAPGHETMPKFEGNHEL